MKTCNVCRCALSLEAFNRDKAQRDGKCGSCRECSRARLSRWTRDNPEWNRTRAASWSKNNPEKRNASIRERRQRDIESARARKLVAQRRRTVRIKASGVVLSPKQVRALIVDLGNECARCGATTALELDHILPVAKGGASIRSNLRPLCKGCNTRKGVDVIDYRRGVL